MKKSSGTQGCTIDGCMRPHVANGMCDAHYRRLRLGLKVDQSAPIREQTRSDPRVRDSEGRKQCSACRAWLATNDFYVRAKSSDGLTPKCRSCTKAAKRRWAYGVSTDVVLQMLATQKGHCAICEVRIDPDSPRSMYVDHDHATGAVRGLLCSGCNTGIGFFRDSRQLLAEAVSYLLRGGPSLELELEPITPPELTLADRKKLQDVARRYGSSVDELAAAFGRQGGRCAICASELSLSSKFGMAVDHDHACCSGKTSCGKCVRGLLCSSCNGGLGAFRDSIDFLQEASPYLAGVSLSVGGAAAFESAWCLSAGLDENPGGADVAVSP